jgi:hypothetical protein
VEVKAIVLVTGPSEDEHNREQTQLAATPLALADVLGRPAIHHLVRHLQRQNVNDIAVVSSVAMPPLGASSRREQLAMNWTVAEGAQLWRAAEECFIDLAQKGAEEILILRVGPYRRRIAAASASRQPHPRHARPRQARHPDGPVPGGGVASQ